MYIFSTSSISAIFFFNDTATTEIYTLSLHDALPILALALWPIVSQWLVERVKAQMVSVDEKWLKIRGRWQYWFVVLDVDRKSTRLNSSHSQISYAVFCLKKKKDSGKRTHTEHTCKRH